ncbi:MAG: tyrosine-type recombinase/integrase [bacterium]|nr:tyrosine-type recombinase/integrase [bacterium]
MAKLTIKKNGLNVNFYLSSPKAKTQSSLYVSISTKKKSKSERLRFPSGESFLTSYTHFRERKGGKDLVRRHTPFEIEYRNQLHNIRDTLIKIHTELSGKNESFTLDNVRDEYYSRAGLIETQTITFDGAWLLFLSGTQSVWGVATRQHFNALYAHLTAFKENIQLNEINETFWNDWRDKYFVAIKKFSNNSINKNLKKFKQFLHFVNRKEMITPAIKVNEFKYLDELQTPFKIALKLHEVETLLNLDLTNNTRLERVRDLFALEIFTGQRFSDIPKLIDKNNISDTSITIYQQKTNEQVTIPMHPQLKKHLKNIFKKYPEGLPIITNQKFNEYLKDLCKLAGFTQQHSFIRLVGKNKIKHLEFRYDLISSHTGRRTFCTLALAEGLKAELIMKVSGHQSYEQFAQYVKVDDADVQNEFKDFMNTKKK